MRFTVCIIGDPRASDRNQGFVVLWCTDPFSECLELSKLKDRQMVVQKELLLPPLQISAWLQRFV